MHAAMFNHKDGKWKNGAVLEREWTAVMLQF